MEKEFQRTLDEIKLNLSNAMQKLLEASKIIEGIEEATNK